MSSDLLVYALRLADDALVLGHRLSEWSSRGPTLEEDLALSNLGLDLIGQARLCYGLAEALDPGKRSEDAFAYFREASAYTNLLLVEQPNGDFAETMVRHLLWSAFMHPYLERLMLSTEPRLAEIAAKGHKEMAYHLRHSAEWVIRLGDGTEESKVRTSGALERLWRYTGELFEMDAVETRLAVAGIAPDRQGLRPRVDQTLDAVFREATLARPKPGWMPSGGRRGHHSEHLGHMLAAMQSLARTHPGATW